MRTMKTTLLMTVFMVIGFNLPLLQADCLKGYHPDHSGGWVLDISPVIKSVTLESTDEYLSGALGNEDWKAKHDVDGELYGLSIRVTPPVLGKRVTAYFSYLTGELDGKFSTRELRPTPEGPYSGKVEFDRDEWVLGADVLILNAVYARLEYSTYEMDGDWDYDIVTPDEPQEYEYDAFTLGVGFRQDFPLDYLAKVFLDRPHDIPSSRFAFVVDAFFGISRFEYEHTEKTAGASVDTDDIGYEGRLELLGTYKAGFLRDNRIFAGGGYSYKKTDGDDLDMTNDGLYAKIGVEIRF